MASPGQSLPGARFAGRSGFGARLLNSGRQQAPGCLSERSGATQTHADHFPGLLGRTRKNRGSTAISRFLPGFCVVPIAGARTADFFSSCLTGEAICERFHVARVLLRHGVLTLQPRPPPGRQPGGIAPFLRNFLWTGHGVMSRLWRRWNHPVAVTRDPG